MTPAFGTGLTASDVGAAAPLVVVGDEQFRLSGATTVEQLLNTLPQFIPHRTAFYNNGGDGTVDLDLRGLGPSRTLVLVDGRRWFPADFSERADVNTLPVFLIEAVDIVTGGGSAVYGPGAVAGVVNFRRRALSGLEAGGTLAITGEADGGRQSAHLGYGRRLGDSGHVSAYAEYARRRPLPGSAREIGRFDLFKDTLTGEVFPIGSSAVPEGVFRAFGEGEGTNYSGFGAIFAAPGLSRPFVSSGVRPDGDQFNYQPYNHLMVPQERWLIGGRAEYELSSWLRVYAEGDFISNEVAHQLAPSNFFSSARGTTQLDLAAVAQHLSASDLAQLQLISERQATPGFARLEVRYRTTQAGPRRFVSHRHAWRGLAGITGNLTRSLTYDLSYQYSHTRSREDIEGAIAESRFNALIENGTCNVFGANLLSDACLSAISLPLRNRDTGSLQVAQARVAGPLVTWPWSGESVSFSVGAEWRSRRFSAKQDDDARLWSIILQPPISGGYRVAELFGQLRIPISSWFDANGGARISDYSLPGVGSAWSWFVAAELRPAPGLTLRGQYQRAVQVPNLRDLFAAQSRSVDFAIDPCGGDSGPGPESIRALCIATGVPPERVFSEELESFRQVDAVRSGNPNLREENANAWTAGLTLRPRFLPRLTIAADYFSIRVEDIPRSFGADETIAHCYFIDRTTESSFCRAIARNPETGELASVDSRPQNVGALRTRGVDLLVSYLQPLAFSLAGAGESQLAFHFLGTWTQRHDVLGLPGRGALAEEFQIGGSSNVACAGRFGSGGGGSSYRLDQFGSCGEPKPRWSWTTRLSWLDGPFTTSLRWRRTGAVTDDFADGPVEHAVERIRAYNLFDLALSVQVRESLNITMGINNLLNREPPILAEANDLGVSTWPGTYGVLGRDLFVSATVRF